MVRQVRLSAVPAENDRADRHAVLASPISLARLGHLSLRMCSHDVSSFVSNSTSFSRVFSAANGPVSSTGSQAQVSLFKFTPQVGQSPLQSGRHTGMRSTASVRC